MKFCQIVDNKVHWIFEADTKPEFAPYIIIKDITNLNPQPQEGWNYDENTDTFSEPVHTVPAPIITMEELQANQLTIMSALADIYVALPPAV